MEYPLERCNPMEFDSSTPIIQVIGASSTLVIPSGAHNWTFTVLTGTATINNASVPAGFSDSSEAEILSAITIVTGSASSAYIRYGV